MQRLGTFIRLVGALSVIGLASCGAPTKSPEDVGHIFNPGAGQSKNLSTRLSEVCNELGARQQEPTIQGKFLQASDCTGAGSIAQDFNQLKQFYFQGFDSSNLKAQAEDEVLRLTTRSQVWLNSSIIDMASSLSGVLGQRNGESGILDIGGDDGGISKLAKADIKFLQPFSFNRDDFSFSALLNLKLTGAVIADHDIAINGRLIDNTIAVTVKTTKDRVYDESVLKGANAVILVIPYAQDIYVDFFLDLEVNSIGFDGLVKGQVESILGTAIKKFMDGLKSL